MNTQNTEQPEILTGVDATKLLAQKLVFIIQGLRRGSIVAQPIIDMENADENSYPMRTLEEDIWIDLNKVGVTERKAEEPPVEAPKKRKRK